MAKQYVIRGTHWGYNDQVFYPSGSYIHSTFDNKAAAIKRLETLEVAHWRETDFGETEVFCYGGKALYDKINEFTLKECNIKILDSNNPRESYIPSQLSKKAVLELLKIADLEAYSLVVYDETVKYYALYFLKQKRYLSITEFEQDSVELIYSESIAELTKEAEELKELISYDYFDDKTIKIKGTLPEISDNPTALAEIISQKKGLVYSEDPAYLEIKPKIKLFFLVNDLLKKPLFEIRTVDIQQIQKLEEKLLDDMYDGEC